MRRFPYGKPIRLFLPVLNPDTQAQMGHFHESEGHTNSARLCTHLPLGHYSNTRFSVLLLDDSFDLYTFAVFQTRKRIPTVANDVSYFERFNTTTSVFDC